MNLRRLRSLLLLIILAGIASCVDTGSITSYPMTVEATLKRVQTSGGVPPDLQIEYDDMHGLWGGTTIVIKGKGNGERRERARGDAEPKIFNKSMSKEQLLELVKLLIEHEAWEQRTPDREPIPDESRGTLSISVGGQSNKIWEWFNDMKKTQRLIKIKEKMTQMTS